MVVIKKFKDKYTKKIYSVGDKYTGIKKRVDELTKLGFIKAEKAKKKQGD